MRALVISDTHFGAWTGRDLLREDFFLERLAPALDGVDEVILLGDLFDFLFGSVAEAVDASADLLALIARELPGKRFVFLAGNHDHHLVYREQETRRVEDVLARGEAPDDDGVPPPEPPGPTFFRRFLERRLPGLEVEIAYPTYTCAGVLCTHGHYLDPHARMAGSRGSRLLTRTLWGIAAGGPEQPRTAADYESVITLLTEWLYIAAQMPHGTHAQQNVFRAAQKAGRVASTLGAPMRGASRLAGEVRARTHAAEAGPLPSARHFEAVVRDEAERQAREAPLPGRPGAVPRYPEPTVLSRSSPTEHALEAFSKVVANLDWGKEADKIVFAHTHQALDDAAPEPRLVELLADLNPLAGGPGLPKAPA